MQITGFTMVFQNPYTRIKETGILFFERERERKDAEGEGENLKQMPH